MEGSRRQILAGRDAAVTGPGPLASCRRTAASQWTGKPNSVPSTPPRGRDGARGDDHSSGTAIAGRLEQPTRRLRAGHPRAPPYLVLLRAGFCLPPPLREARCALTAPFHPYPPTLPAQRAEGEGGRYVFCATVRRVAPPGCYPAHCPAEFGLSSPRHPRGRRAAIVLVHCDPSIVARDEGRHGGLVSRRHSRGYPSPS